VLWLAARAEADEATRARDRREEIGDGAAARYRELASRAGQMATPGVSSRGYQALVTAELARAAGEADVTAWQAAAETWQAAAEPYPLAYTLLRLASRVGAVPIAEEAAALARRTRLSLDEPGAGRGPAGGRGSAGPVRADRTRAGDPAAAGRGPVQPPDRRGLVHQP
jgi:hypothetical protein